MWRKKTFGIKFFHFPKDKNEVSLGFNFKQRKNGLDDFKVVDPLFFDIFSIFFFFFDSYEEFIEELKFNQ